MDCRVGNTVVRFKDDRLLHSGSVPGPHNPEVDESKPSPARITFSGLRHKSEFSASFINPNAPTKPQS